MQKQKYIYRIILAGAYYEVLRKHSIKIGRIQKQIRTFQVARLVDELGSVVILKNNAPRYLVIDFSKADESAVAKDEDVLEISKRLLAQNKEAYEVLAK